MADLASLTLEILESVADGVVVFDERGRIVHATRRACELFGYEPDDLVGQAAEMLVPPASRSVHERMRSTYGGDPRHREMGSGLPLEGLRRDGSVVPLDIRLAPLRSDGLVVASIRAATDPEVDVLRSRLDTVAQHLFAIGLALSTLEQGSADGADRLRSTTDLADRLRSTTDLVDRTIELAGGRDPTGG